MNRQFLVNYKHNSNVSTQELIDSNCNLTIDIINDIENGEDTSRESIINYIKAINISKSKKSIVISEEIKEVVDDIQPQEETTVEQPQEETIEEQPAIIHSRRRK